MFYCSVHRDSGTCLMVNTVLHNGSDVSINRGQLTYRTLPKIANLATRNATWVV